MRIKGSDSLPAELSALAFADPFCAKRICVKANTATRATNGAMKRYLMWRLPSLLGSLLLLLRLGPLAGRLSASELQLPCSLALPGACWHVDGLFSHAAPAATAEPLAIGNKHELRTSPESPVALGRNEAHQEFVPGLE